MAVQVQNIPSGLKSIFVPLSVTDQALELYSARSEDIFFNNYLPKIEKDKGGNLAGLSLISKDGSPLPAELNVKVKVRLNATASSTDKVKTTTNTLQPEEQTVLSYPNSTLYQQAVTAEPSANAKNTPSYSVNWPEPLVYDKFTEKLNDSTAGFSSLSLTDASSLDQTKKYASQIAKPGGFYIKSLGKTVLEGERRNRRRQTPTENFQDLAKIEEATIFLKLPPKGDFRQLFVPVSVQNPNSVVLVLLEERIPAGYVLRLLDDDLFEFSASAPNVFLPNDKTISARVLLLKNPAIRGGGRLVLGPVLSEAANAIAGVQVTLTPYSFFEAKPVPIDPRNLFKL